MPKETVRRLINNFSNLKSLLFDLRNNKQLSYKEISVYFSLMGYSCSDSLIKRLYIKYKLDIKRDVSGNKNSFYGKTHTSESKMKMSSTRKRMGYSKGSKNFFYGKIKENSPAWKGGKSTKQAIFYSSEDWNHKRFEIMIRDGFICKECNYNPGNKRNSLNVHHIEPISQNWEKKLDDNNLITLCINCHIKTFGKEIELIKYYKNLLNLCPVCDSELIKESGCEHCSKCEFSVCEIG